MRAGSLRSVLLVSLCAALPLACFEDSGDGDVGDRGDGDAGMASDERCQDLHDAVAECGIEDPASMSDYCAYEFEESSGAACSTATEDLFACLSQASCGDLQALNLDACRWNAVELIERCAIVTETGGENLAPGDCEPIVVDGFDSDGGDMYPRGQPSGVQWAGAPLLGTSQ